MRKNFTLTFIKVICFTILGATSVNANSVDRQTSEFIDIEGQVALKMDLISPNGDQTLVFGCNNPGVYIVASIVAVSDTVAFSQAALILDDERVDPAFIEVIGFEDARVVLLFGLSPELTVAAMEAVQIGPYYFDDDLQQWIGHVQDIDQAKFKEIVNSCT